MTPRALPDPALLRELLSYDAGTGQLTWKCARNWKARVGSIAGRIGAHGYRVIKIGAIGFLAHRLAWAIHYGEQPPTAIDHADLDKDNNRISNLRAASASENCANAPRRLASSSPYKGVIWNTRDRCWRARICVRGKRRQLGSFATAEEAAAAYRAAAESAFGSFAREA